MGVTRFDRLEDKVEKLDDKVNSIKEDVLNLRADVKMYASEVSKHVAGDEKIISEIVPTLNMFKSFLEEDMPEIKQLILEKKAQQLVEKQKIKDKTNWKLTISIVSGLLGIVYTLYKMDLIKF